MKAYVSSFTTVINIPPTVSKKLNIALIFTTFCFCAFILNNSRRAHFSELPMTTHLITTRIITSHVCDLNLLTLISSVQYDLGINKPVHEISEYTVSHHSGLSQVFC